VYALLSNPLDAKWIFVRDPGAVRATQEAAAFRQLVAERLGSDALPRRAGTDASLLRTQLCRRDANTTSELGFGGVVSAMLMCRIDPDWLT
jgi:hypothetical protein